MHQLYVERLPMKGETVHLEGDEAHYLGRALRARVGERFRLADADGRAAIGELLGFGQGRAELRVEAPDPDMEEAFGLHLLLCPPRGDALDEALDMAVQLGALSLRLLRSERTLASPGQGALKPDRLHRRIREAARQCLRARLPPLLPDLDLDAGLNEPAPGRRLLCSERGGRSLAQVRADAPEARAYSLLVGPEGGFSAAELERAAAAGWTAVSLGPRPLRVPTAVASVLGGLRALQP